MGEAKGTQVTEYNGHERRRERADQDRWHGQVDARIENLSSQIPGLERDIDALQKALAAMSIELAVLKTKVAVWAAGGSVVGGAFVAFLFRQFG